MKKGTGARPAEGAQLAGRSWRQSLCRGPEQRSTLFLFKGSEGAGAADSRQGPGRVVVLCARALRRTRASGRRVALTAPPARRRGRWPWAAAPAPARAAGPKQTSGARGSPEQRPGPQGPHTSAADAPTGKRLQAGRRGSGRAGGAAGSGRPRNKRAPEAAAQAQADGRRLGAAAGLQATAGRTGGALGGRRQLTSDDGVARAALWVQVHQAQGNHVH